MTKFVFVSGCVPVVLCGRTGRSRPFTKILMVMKLTFLLLTAAFLSVQAESLAQPVTISGKDITLKQIFSAIEEQTGYVLFSNRKILTDTKPVTLDVHAISLPDLLKIVFKDQPLDYLIQGKTITLSRKAEPVYMKPVSTPVRGRVLDPEGQPVPGVTVRIKGRETGTATDAAGYFRLELNDGETLVITGIGFMPLTIRLNDQSFEIAGVSNSSAASRLVSPEASALMIQFARSTSPLDEVQIQAYSKISRRFSPGNVVMVKASDIEKQPVNNPLYALQGRVPGLTISPSTGLAGSAVNLQIRGRNTLALYRKNEPLVVVDGLPVLNNIPGLGHSGFMTNTGNEMSALSFLNLNDIESVSVLKDADATSIYGSRGANGVILITTKKGGAGETKVSLDAQRGWSRVPGKMDMMNTQQYLAVRKEAIANSGFILENEALRLRYVDVKLWDPNRYTDWQDVLIGGTAGYTNLQGTVSGGSSAVQYLIGGNYRKETTVFPGDNADQKAAVRLSLTGASANQRFRATLNASYLADMNTLPGSDFTRLAIKLAPNAPALRNADGSLNWELMPSGQSSWDNPLYELNRLYDAKVNNLITSADVSYRILPSLTLKTQVGYNLLEGSAFRSNSPFRDRNPASGNFPASINLNANNVRNISVEPQLTHSWKKNDLSLESLVGAAYQRNTVTSQQTSAGGFTSDALLRNLALATDVRLQNTSSEYKYAAIFGRVSAVWRSKYILNLTARRDGSSRFGPGNQFGNFGSAAAAWIFSEEEMLRRLAPGLSFGKLRFSYGTSGNDGIGDYAYLERYSSIQGVLPYQNTVGFRTMGAVNTYYAWEVTRKAELGLELGFLEDRIYMTASFYRNRSGNQLLSYDYPATIGPGSPAFNRPVLIQSHGMEYTLQTTNIKTRHFSWSTTGNISVERNKLLKYPGLENSADYQDFEIGKPYAGMEKAYANIGVDPVTGVYQFRAIDGSIVFNPQDVNRLDNGRYLRIMSTPKFYGGIGNTFSYRQFGLDFLFQFVKQTGRSPMLDFTRNAGGFGSNLPVAFLSRWQKPGDVTEFQKVFSDNSANTPLEYRLGLDWIGQSDAYYEDASFIRLKNLSLSYRLSDAALQRLKIKNLRVYVQGQNLLTFTSYRGFDPETQSVTSLPMLRTLITGIQITL